MTSDVAVPEGRNLVFPDDNDYAVMSYDELMGMETFRVSGFTILSKDELIGVPHIITKVTYWQPLAGRIGHATCEATLASPEYLSRAIGRGWIPNVSNVSDLRIEPNERIVYNDGSTGIRRQLTQLFHHRGAIDVGHEDVQDDSRFDTPWPDWESFTETRRQSAAAGDVPCVSKVLVSTSADREAVYKPLILRADRGLRVSEYANEFTDDGRTFYLG